MYKNVYNPRFFRNFLKELGNIKNMKNQLIQLLLDEAWIDLLFLSSSNKVVGSVYLTALGESSYSLICGMLATFSMIDKSFGNLTISPGNIKSMYLTNSYIERSISVKYPKNQLSCLAISSYFCSLGVTLFFHWYFLSSINYSGVFFWQLMLMMLPIVSIVHTYIFKMALSSSVFPNKSGEPNLLIK